MKKIIFLDMDGVLNSDRYWNQQKRGLTYPTGDWISWWIESFDPKAVKVLNSIIENTSAKIVFSSSRRNWLDFNDLKTVFRQVGIIGELIDITPFLNWKSREEEIKQWLEENECDSYLIIDDVDDFPSMKSKWLKVNPRDGLTEDHIKKAINLII